MKKLLTNNLGLKLLSLAIAFAVWLVVVNIDDPVITASFSGVVVEIVNGDTLADKGKIYEIPDGADVIDVTITGKRSVVETIGKDNIKAVADVNDLSQLDTVEIKLSTNKNNEQIDAIKSSTPFIQLDIENLMEVHLPISVAMNGEPEEGYIVGDRSLAQNTVRVSGPESIISRIESAKVSVDVTGRTSDISTSCDIRFYDDKGAAVESPYISTNMRSVNFSATILPTKAVDIIYAYSGEPKDGYMVSDEIQADRKAIYIAGKQNVIDNIWSIEIPADVVDITDAEKTVVRYVDISNYLPMGVRFYDSDFSGKVKITVPVEKSVERTFDVPVSNVALVNVPAGFNGEVLFDNATVTTDPDTNKQATMKVATSGILGQYDTLTNTNIKGYVDVEEYLKNNPNTTISEGVVYKMPITFNVPDRIVVDEVYYAEVKFEAVR